MLTIEEKLRLILAANTIRGNGKTRLILNGLKNSENVTLITHTINFGKALKYRNHLTQNIKIISIDNLDALRGDEYPIIFDNLALELLLREVLSELDKFNDLKNHLFRIKREISLIKDI